jgi:hypothetical protein
MAVLETMCGVAFHPEGIVFGDASAQRDPLLAQ